MNAPALPSWLRWPPNCCETCLGWSREGAHYGRCTHSIVNAGDLTDSRFRCQDFKRKPEVSKS